MTAFCDPEGDVVSTPADGAADANWGGQRHHYNSTLILAQNATDANKVGRARELLSSQLPHADLNNDLRRWEWHYLWRATHRELSVKDAHSRCLRWTPQGDQLTAATRTGFITIYNSDATTEFSQFQAYETHQIQSIEHTDLLATSDDGRILLITCGQGFHSVWDLSARACPELELSGDDEASLHHVYPGDRLR